MPHESAPGTPALESEEGSELGGTAVDVQVRSSSEAMLPSCVHQLPHHLLLACLSIGATTFLPKFMGRAAVRHSCSFGSCRFHEGCRLRDGAEGTCAHARAQCGRGQFFVRLRVRRSGAGAFGRPPLMAVIDHYIDSGSGEWLIPRCCPAIRSSSLCLASLPRHASSA